MKLIESLMLRALMGAKRLVKLSPGLTAHLYDLMNRQVFTDLVWHERMLADRPRIEAYRKGIAGSVHADEVVIDLGTGTGILAAMAAKAGARRVYAIDHSDLIEIAKEIARRNGLGNITFVAQNSREFVPPEPADVLLHEQLGPAIFGENMVMNLLDLKRRALKPTGRIVPAVFDLYIEPVALKEEYLIPKIWDIGGLEVDLAFLQEYPPLQKHLGEFHGIRTVKNFEVDYLLCEPAPILSIDLNTLRGEQDIERQHSVSKLALRDGPMDGFCIYFRGHFENGATFDNAPSSPQTNWENIIIRRPRSSVAAGDLLNYTIALSDIERPRTWEVRVADPARRRPERDGPAS
jgi:protein arginine N-methyltransferase 1